MSHTGAMSVHGGTAFSTLGALSSQGMRTPDRTVESTSSEEEDRADLLGRNFHVPRPKSRSSIAVSSSRNINMSKTIRVKIPNIDQKQYEY
jgi:hypothetical protein